MAKERSPIETISLRRKTGPGKPGPTYVTGIVCGVVVLSLVVAGLVAADYRKDRIDADARAASEACARRAATMPAPWHNDSARSSASPASPFSRGALWVAPYASAEKAADDAEDNQDWLRAERLRKVAQQARAVWFTDTSIADSQVTARVASTVRAAAAKGQVAVLVVYAIPLRDCGGESSGGAASGTDYVSWIKAFVAGLKSGGSSSGPGVSIILEPDALGLLDRLTADRQTERFDLLRAATSWLTNVPRTAVYLDAGHSGWVSVSDMTSRLSRAGVSMARGFSLNVSNFRTTDGEVRYGQQISPRLGWKRFVLDTSRNGNGPSTSSEWCNPSGRALGPAPQINPAAQVDAYLWIKPPGESDGACRAGQPSAGTFWPEYADELARNAGW